MGSDPSFFLHARSAMLNCRIVCEPEPERVKVVGGDLD